MAWISRYGLPSVLKVRAFFIIMNALQVFSYKGSNVTFSNENGMWVNATEMAKPFGKKPIDWLRQQSTNEFLETLFKVRNTEGKVSPTHFENQNYYGFVVTERGGANPCSWFHEDVAIEFARWLAPAFAIWCNDRIKEILKGGSNIPTTADEIIAYGYGKALEKISRQSNVIKKQSKRIAALVSQLESEKEAKRERLAIASEVKSGDIEKWLSESGLKGLYKLSDLHRRYHGYCGNNNSAYFTTRKLGNILRKKGYTSIHKRNGTWFII